MLRREFMKLTLAAGIGLTGGTAIAADMPAPFDKPEEVKIALVRYLSTGDFFQSYLAGVESQAEALGVDLRVFDSRQDAALQADMVDQAIALGVDGIVIQHGLTESMKPAAQRAVDAGIKVVAFDVNVENDAIPQVEQSDYLLGKMALDQAIKDNGNSFTAGYVYVPGIAPLDRRDKAWKEVKEANPGIKEAAMFGTLDNPIANSVANQARSVLQANPTSTSSSRLMTNSPRASRSPSMRPASARTSRSIRRTFQQQTSPPCANRIPHGLQRLRQTRQLSVKSAFARLP